MMQGTVNTSGYFTFCLIFQQISVGFLWYLDVRQEVVEAALYPVRNIRIVEYAVKTVQFENV